MKLTAHLQALADIARGKPQPDDDAGEFWRAQRQALAGYCANLQAEGRTQTLAALEAYRALTRPARFRFADSAPVKIDAELAQALVTVQGYLEAEYSQPLAEGEAIETPEELRTFKNAAKPGYGAAPPAFLRSALFTSSDPSERIFRVLGFTGTTIERAGRPLEQRHLAALVYALGHVRGWGSEGTTLAVDAWEAVRALGWAENKASVQRLLETYEDMQLTRIRVAHGPDSGESAPIVGKVTYSNDRKTKWTVQLTSTLLDALARKNLTFLKLETIAALPSGAATWLYGFIASEAYRETRWKLEDLAAAAGLTSANKYKRKEKLRDALETMVAGVVEVKARGLATHQGAGELTETKAGRLVVRATAAKLKNFTPPLTAYRFEKDEDGTEWVVLTKPKGLEREPA